MFNDLNDEQLANVRDSVERELSDRAAAAEAKRPKPALEDIRRGMSTETRDAVLSEISRVLKTL